MLISITFWLWFLSLSLISYGMYIVAWLLESRRPGRDTPIWRGQSKAYMPGDFGLALMVAVAICQRSIVALPNWSNSTYFLVMSVVIGFGIFYFARKFLYRFEKDYSQKSWHSPSKIYHDFVMYLGYGSLAAYTCLPYYFLSSPMITVEKIIGLFGLGIWVVGNVWDFTHNEIPNNKQHPEEYSPIWVSKRNKL